ncbi:cytochrome c oxidase assembly protein COX14 [Aspergillus ruber CBS 135680]|uniref:Cytochrome oxidase c assembly-domain-containing protein n=1 Tax=Aspergillus ruber (strain CBS 135680) TaxID=1388766 RepID=A0A017SAP5_ASPRC|nr:uncharacterized protein EURHEDRAFT_379339 [Aspergillus ruber CBS 135680]EYE93275.1 hypothetical protein EURHEDRAFT_379339 [Aspergillus ruber CBS 135680]
MSRSAADATRFTATGPYASSKPGAPAYKLPGFMSNSGNNSNANPSPGSGGQPETPKQKVERLRAQAKAARMAQSSSGFDRFLGAGRDLANKAHKVTVYSLIAASGVCGVLTVYSIISLTLYNRRQKALWVENELKRLEDAKRAHASGIATPEQAEIVKNEMIGEIYKRKKDEEKEQRPWNQVKRYLFGGLKADEAAAAPESAVAVDGQNKPGVLDALNAKAAVDAKSKGEQVPGQLDVLAENAESTAKQASRSWTSWLTGR